MRRIRQWMRKRWIIGSGCIVGHCCMHSRVAHVQPTASSAMHVPPTRINRFSFVCCCHGRVEWPIVCRMSWIHWAYRRVFHLSQQTLMHVRIIGHRWCCTSSEINIVAILWRWIHHWTRWCDRTTKTKRNNREKCKKSNSGAYIIDIWKRYWTCRGNSPRRQISNWTSGHAGYQITLLLFVWIDISAQRRRMLAQRWRWCVLFPWMKSFSNSRVGQWRRRFIWQFVALSGQHGERSTSHVWMFLRITNGKADWKCDQSNNVNSLSYNFLVQRRCLFRPWIFIYSRTVTNMHVNLIAWFLIKSRVTESVRVRFWAHTKITLGPVCRIICWLKRKELAWNGETNPFWWSKS